MPYDESLAERLRPLFKRRKNVEEKKMFGGVCFFLNGHICCGIHKNSLILRLGADEGEIALLRPHVRPFDITGRPMTGWVMVNPKGIPTEDDLKQWINRALAFVKTLPAK